MAVFIPSVNCLLAFLARRYIIVTFVSERACEVTRTASILIVSRNDFSTIEKAVLTCLALNFPHDDFEVVVYDDFSDRPQLDILERLNNEHAADVAAGRLKIIFGKPHAGLGRGRNAAADASNGKYLFYLDGDAYAPPGWITETLPLFEQKDIGVVSPRVVFARRPDIMNGQGCSLTLYGEGRDHYALMPAGNASDNSNEVLYAMGCGMVIRRDCWDQAGRFDDDIAYSHDDVEFCIRAWKTGWRVVTCPRVVILHDTAAYSAPSRRKMYFNYRNRWLMILKHWPLHWMLVAAACETLVAISSPPVFVRPVVGFRAMIDLRKSLRKILHYRFGKNGKAMRLFKRLFRNSFRNPVAMYYDVRLLRENHRCPAARKVDFTDSEIFHATGAIEPLIDSCRLFIRHGTVEIGIFTESKRVILECKPCRVPVDVRADFISVSGTSTRECLIPAGGERVEIFFPPGSESCRMEFTSAERFSGDSDPIEPTPLIAIKRITQS